MAKKLLNPRGYLSWTQISMWLQSPEKYVRHYIHGEAEFKNSAMDFGSKTALALETGDQSDDELINALVAMIPRYKSPEHEIRAPFKTKNGEVDLLGKLDSFCPDTYSIMEYKTGRNGWTQRKAETHKQLDHYNALVWLKHKIIPPKSELIWAETEQGENGIILTGHVETFEVTKSLSEILEYLAIVARVAREIDARYKEELKKLT